MLPTMIAAKKAQQLKESPTFQYLLIGVLGTAALGTAAYFLVRAIQNRTQNQAYDNAHLTHHPASFATGIRMAFQNDGLFGTNVPLLRSILQEIPTKEFFSKVQTEFRKLTKGNNLMENMKSELTASEFQEMVYILDGKPQTPNPQYYDPKAWAKRLKAAFEYTVWGIEATDEDAIRAVLTEMYKLPNSSQAFSQLENAYLQLNGREFMHDMDAEFAWQFYDKGEFYQLIQAIKQK